LSNYRGNLQELQNIACELANRLNKPVTIPSFLLVQSKQSVYQIKDLLNQHNIDPIIINTAEKNSNINGHQKVLSPECKNLLAELNKNVSHGLKSKNIPAQTHVQAKQQVRSEKNRSLTANIKIKHHLDLKNYNQNNNSNFLNIVENKTNKLKRNLNELDDQIHNHSNKQNDKVCLEQKLEFDDVNIAIKKQKLNSTAQIQVINSCYNQNDNSQIENKIQISSDQLPVNINQARNEDFFKLNLEKDNQNVISLDSNKFFLNTNNSEYDISFDQFDFNLNDLEL
jgi:hypothetical protein